MIETMTPYRLLEVVKMLATEKVAPTEVRDGNTGTYHNSIWEWRDNNVAPFRGLVRFSLSSELDQTSVVSSKDKQGNVTKKVRWFRPERATLLHACLNQATTIRFNFPTYDAIGYDFSEQAPLPQRLVLLIAHFDIDHAIVVPEPA